MVANPDWPEMLRYARKLNVEIIFNNGKACVKSGDTIFNDTNNLQKRLFKLCINRDVEKAKQLAIQGPFLGMKGVQLKASHSLFYNWGISDQLVMLVIKARLSLLPTNFTTYIWNRANSPTCPFCRRHTESIAHLMNGCYEFRNFYSRRHNRIAERIAQEIRSSSRIRWRIYEDKLFETILPEYDDVKSIQHRKVDIVVIEPLSKRCVFVEISVCFDLYLDISYTAKGERYGPLINFLSDKGWDVSLKVLSFGPLGCVKNTVWGDLRKIGIEKEHMKDVLSWCSISNIIMANYIWRHRVKKLLPQS